MDSYQAWLAVNQFTDKHAKAFHGRLDTVASPLPRISVIMPVYNPNPKFLDQAIRSVAAQIYGNWELCIADDASTDEDVHMVLSTWERNDKRIRVVHREANGNISLATNDAARLATGEFLAFLDHDDLLTPDALGEIALALAANPDADLLYSDDDKVDQHNGRFAPQFKPDWSPELLLSYMYVSHIVVVRRKLFEALGGMRVGFEGSQDYDFVLRAAEYVKQVIHLPYVLYHWRVVTGSTALSADAKPASFEAGRRAVEEALCRRGLSVPVVQQDWAKRDRLGIFRPLFQLHGPSVTVIIPTKNQWKLLDRCLDSLKKTTYANWRLLVIDNDSDEVESVQYLNSLQCRVIRIPNPGPSFNFAHVNNLAASQADSDYILFLNNDTEVLSPEWLSVMVGYAQIEGVGAVGARLLYPDGRVQHMGIVHGLYDGLAGPAFKLLPEWDHGYLGRARVAQNCGAVTAACMLTPKHLFEKLGGFDEVNFAVAYNDVDYCYRLTDAGYRCVVAGEVELLHHEGFSRGFDDSPAEIATFRNKYRFRVDCWYNENLSLENEQFSIRRVRIPRSVLKPPVRVFMCTVNMNWEGAPLSQYELTVALREKGLIDPVVFSPIDGPLRVEYESHGIPVIIDRHPVSEGITLSEYEESIAQLADRIAESQAEVIYGNTLQTFYAIDAAERLRIPSVWNIRESEPWQTYFNYLVNEVAAKALSCYSKPYRVIFVSHATRAGSEVLNVANNVTVIRNGLDLQRMSESCQRLSRCEARSSLGIGDEEVTILLLGTICERKGQKDLVQAAELLHLDGVPAFRVLIVGDRGSSYSDELHRIAAALPSDIRSRVSIISETHSVARYWKSADIFVCTSRVESYPRVILEAMALGLPIVTTPVYGILEQVRPGRNALLYDPGDIESLARHLARLTNDRMLRQRFGESSRVVLSSLPSFDDMVDAYGRTFVEASEICPV